MRHLPKTIMAMADLQQLRPDTPPHRLPCGWAVLGAPSSKKTQRKERKMKRIFTAVLLVVEALIEGDR
jgi:hypothetical protein